MVQKGVLAHLLGLDLACGVNWAKFNNLLQTWATVNKLMKWRSTPSQALVNKAVWEPFTSLCMLVISQELTKLRMVLVPY